mmetsp:Transcript_9242/g.16281  ORF Transcript_9242/g.16281 Transcript_9242/m.16281 type:complete len:280 (+) Transcript_9242:109-948(+)
MHLLLPLALACLLLAVQAQANGMCSAPPDTEAASSSCGGPTLTKKAGEPQLARLIDISVEIAPGLPTWMSETGLGSEYTWLVADMTKGDPYYSSQISLNVHTGTHMDSPAHFVQEEYNGGITIEKLDLNDLVGPALVIEVPAGSNITAAVVRSMNLPADCVRLLLKTQNSAKDLMHNPVFESDYVGFTGDGARYLADHTNVKVVGIDGLSIAAYDENVAGHRALFFKHIIPVEGLDLRELQDGRWYNLTCLPLKLKGAEGAPARCIAYGPTERPMEIPA